MSEEKFLKLVEDCRGFEFYQAYRGDVDHILGGKDDTCWYVIMDEGKVKESYIGSRHDGVWEDTCIKGTGKKRKTKEMPSGSTIRRIVGKAYLMQEEPWVKDRKPRLVEDAHPHYHYVLGFGDKAVDVSAQYGVTIGFSDISDTASGFHLRYLYTGSDVKKPD